MYGWLSLEALRIWLEHGPGRTLVGPASHAAFAAVALRGDYAAGYRALRRILALGEARGYEPDTSQARYAVRCPQLLVRADRERLSAQAQRAREGLIAGGDLAYAGYTYYPTVSVPAGLRAIAGRATSPRSRPGWPSCAGPAASRPAEWLDSYRWLAGVLRGEALADAAGDGGPGDRYAGNPLALSSAHVTPRGRRAPSSAIRPAWRGTPRRRCRCCRRPRASTRPPWPACCAGWPWPGRPAPPTASERDGLLAELDEVTRWLAARAADAPDNFLHLLRLVEAERAWAVGDFRAAALAFDAARREAAQRQRPWHRALIAEHAARFYLAHGLEHAGYDLLAQARQEYLAWGATREGRPAGLGLPGPAAATRRGRRARRRPAR